MCIPVNAVTQQTNYHHLLTLGIPILMTKLGR
jgi:hypothetical protein